MNKTSGPIRFVGGEYHNQLLDLPDWRPVMKLHSKRRPVIECATVPLAMPEDSAIPILVYELRGLFYSPATNLNRHDPQDSIWLEERELGPTLFSEYWLQSRTDGENWGAGLDIRYTPELEGKLDLAFVMSWDELTRGRPL